MPIRHRAEGDSVATVTLRDIVKVYGDFVAIKGIDLDIEDGTFVVFVGPSGCGKSTMLRMIAGLETISYGELKIGGKLVNDLPSRERGIAMVFQSYALYPHMSVNDNLGFGLKISGVAKPEIERRRGEAAKLLGLEPYLERRPSQLSGGQRQRVAIGRAMVREPEVFLFDEPLSNLDAKLRNQTRVEIKRLQRQLGATVIFVTHDQVEAMTLADKIVVLNDGRIAQIGTPLEVFERPTNQFVAGFIGAPSMNFIDGVVGGSTAGLAIEAAGLVVPVEPGRFDLPPAGTPVTLGIRPENVVPEGHGTRPELGVDFEAAVGFAEMLGNESLLFATLGTTEIVSRMQHPRLVEPNEVLRFRIDGHRVHVFDKATQNSVRR
jgi:multiple sugar transport system ATP-binding protein